MMAQPVQQQQRFLGALAPPMYNIGAHMVVPSAPASDKTQPFHAPPEGEPFQAESFLALAVGRCPWIAVILGFADAVKRHGSRHAAADLLKRNNVASWGRVRDADLNLLTYKSILEQLALYVTPPHTLREVTHKKKQVRYSKEGGDAHLRAGTELGEGPGALQVARASVVGDDQGQCCVLSLEEAQRRWTSSSEARVLGHGEAAARRAAAARASNGATAAAAATAATAAVWPTGGRPSSLPAAWRVSSGTEACSSHPLRHDGDHHRQEDAPERMRRGAPPPPIYCTAGTAGKPPDFRRYRRYSRRKCSTSRFLPRSGRVTRGTGLTWRSASLPLLDRRIRTTCSA